MTWASPDLAAALAALLTAVGLFLGAVDSRDPASPAAEDASSPPGCRESCPPCLKHDVAFSSREPLDFSFVSELDCADLFLPRLLEVALDCVFFREMLASSGRSGIAGSGSEVSRSAVEEEYEPRPETPLGLRFKPLLSSASRGSCSRCTELLLPSPARQLSPTLLPEAGSVLDALRVRRLL